MLCRRCLFGQRTRYGIPYCVQQQRGLAPLNGNRTRPCDADPYPRSLVGSQQTFQTSPLDEDFTPDLRPLSRPLSATRLGSRDARRIGDGVRVLYHPPPLIPHLTHARTQCKIHHAVIISLWPENFRSLKRGIEMTATKLSSPVAAPGRVECSLSELGQNRCNLLRRHLNCLPLLSRSRFVQVAAIAQPPLLNQLRRRQCNVYPYYRKSLLVQIKCQMRHW